MDQRLKEALEYSNYRLSLATYKKNILLRAEAIRLVSESGGMFQAEQTLILWIDYLIRSGATQYVVVDINDQPVLLQDLPRFVEKLTDAHAKSMNLLHAETEKIKRARTVDKIVDAPKQETNNEQPGSN